jgi:hypothetical protein
MAAQDLPHHKAWGDVTVDLLQRLGMNVDHAAIDWGTVVARRAQKNAPGQGGWQIYHTSPYGVDLTTPTNIFIRGDGSSGPNGWATNPAVEREISAWFEATNLEEERAGSTESRSITRFLPPWASACATTLGARASTASPRGRCRCSGGSARLFNLSAVELMPVNGTSQTCSMSARVSAFRG